MSDLAAASGLKTTTVSHSLRLLRVPDMVRTGRNGHTILYRSGRHPATDLLDTVFDLSDTDAAGLDDEDARG